MVTILFYRQLGFNNLVTLLKGFTFIVEKKFKNELKNVFIHDKSNVLKNLSADNKNANSITIVSKEGMVEKNRILLVDGQIISTEKNNIKNNVVKFEQLNIDLKDLQTGIIKVPKMQETNTLDLFEVLVKIRKFKNADVQRGSKKGNYYSIK